MYDKYSFNIYLIEGNRKRCRSCNLKLQNKYCEFLVTDRESKRNAIITFPIYYCPYCGKGYITKERYREFQEKHPKYYITHLVKPKKKKKEKKDNKDKKKAVTKFEPYVMEKVNSNAKLFISNTNSVKTKICPKCHSVLVYADMNVAVHLPNGDFYRHYVERVVFCIKCNQGYIDANDVSSLLTRIERRANKKCELRVNNMTVKHNEKDDSYLLLPTLDNDIIVYNPPKKQKGVSEIIEKTNLSSTSFLYDLGYNIKKDDIERRQILYDAVLKYGKRKVADHLSFLISTRMGQENGVNKYKNAISVWQEDKNYVVSIRLEDRVG